MKLQGGTMEKVAGNYYALVATPSTVSHHSMGSGIAPLSERSSAIRGHHSSVGKALDAHRSMVEERQARNLRRGIDPMATQQPNDFVIANEVVEGSQAAAAEADPYENTMIEPAMSQAKMAAVQSFTSQEPDRPIMGEPVPKGSYLDVEA